MSGTTTDNTGYRRTTPRRETGNCALFIADFFSERRDALPNFGASLYLFCVEYSIRARTEAQGATLT